MHWKADPPTNQRLGRDKDFSQPSSKRETLSISERPEIELVGLPIILFLIAGLFLGAFSVALLFRRIAVALAITGPLLFSTIWILHDWKHFHGKRFALGAFAAGFTLTFLALDREP